MCCHIKLPADMDWHNVLVVVKLIVTMLYGQSLGSHIDVLDQRNLRGSKNNSVLENDARDNNV